MTLAAHEDKTFGGAYVASPTHALGLGPGPLEPDATSTTRSGRATSTSRHRAARGRRPRRRRARARLPLRRASRSPTAASRRTRTVDGTAEVDEPAARRGRVPDRARLAARPPRRRHLRARQAPPSAASSRNGPETPQERWENQGGWSPAHDRLRDRRARHAPPTSRAQRRRRPSADAWEATADEWQSKVDGWTVTTNGPYSTEPYYLRITKEPEGRPDRRRHDLQRSATPAPTASTSARSPTRASSSSCASASSATTTRRSSTRSASSTSALGVDTPNGALLAPLRLRRLRRDEDRRDLGHRPAQTCDAAVRLDATIGRIWPIFAGERGEYELAAGQPDAARGRLAAMAAAGQRRAT